MFPLRRQAACGNASPSKLNEQGTHRWSALTAVVETRRSHSPGGKLRAKVTTRPSSNSAADAGAEPEPEPEPPPPVAPEPPPPKPDPPVPPALPPVGAGG